MLNGFINLYKNSGMTSNKAISILKRHLNYNNVNTKVGHFGTLDPMAEGVLPVALGRATRLFDYFIDKKKEYHAVFQFGKETDTLDSEGTIIKECNKLIKKEDILKVLSKLIGEIEQLPPKYSAKSVNGKRAYELARKGIEFELKKKKIIIYDIKLVEDLGDNSFSFNIVCSGGTYIRAIARDIAEMLGTVAIMTYLKRTVSGAFSIEKSVSVDNLENKLMSHILPIDYILADFDRFNINEHQKTLLLNGLKLGGMDLPEGFFSVYSEDRLIGIGEKNENNKLEIRTWLL